MENKIIVSRKDLKLIEVFMGYADGYLSEKITWNDIMPAVEKIESMDYGFKMCRKVVEVYIDSTKEQLFKIKETSRIESTYTAVLEFINWYNTHTNGA